MYQPTKDLAGEVCFRGNFRQTKTRINYLIEEYLNLDQLCDRLEDLPQQFTNPQPRRWSATDWQDINPEQVINLELDIFLSIIKGALDRKKKSVATGVEQAETSSAFPPVSIPQP